IFARERCVWGRLARAGSFELDELVPQLLGGEPLVAHVLREDRVVSLGAVREKKLQEQGVPVRLVLRRLLPPLSPLALAGGRDAVELLEPVALHHFAAARETTLDEPRQRRIHAALHRRPEIADAARGDAREVVPALLALLEQEAENGGFGRREHEDIF